MKLNHTAALARVARGLHDKNGTMASVVWEFQDDVLVVKLVANYTMEQLFQAFKEAVARPECRVGTTLLLDARSAFETITPDTVRH